MILFINGIKSQMVPYTALQCMHLHSFFILNIFDSYIYIDLKSKHVKLPYSIFDDQFTFRAANSLLNEIRLVLK